MESNRKRIFVCGIHQESNCFNPILTSKSMFAISEGENSKTLASNRKIPGGMFSRLLADEGVELIYGTVMSASSGAPLQADVWRYFLDSVLPDIKKAGRLDAVGVCMHGATMAEDTDDVCGCVLEAIRKTVGEEIPISVGFDLHANITEKIMRNADYICGFLEYPHIDQYETGVRAAELLLRHLKGKPAKMARVTIPMIAPAHGYTTTEGGLLKLTERAKAMVVSGKILDYTIFQVQPWLDAKEMGATVVVIAEDEETAKGAARELAVENFRLRQELVGKPLESVEAVIQKALTNKTGKPVILVDSADSRGAGSTADSAQVIEALLPYRDQLKCAVGVSDAEAVKKAFSIGVGNRGDFTLGASVAPELSKPVMVRNALVRSLHDGCFALVGPIGRGEKGDCGKVAVLQVGKILIQVSTHTRHEGDIGFFRGFGIDPELCDLVSVKACTSFRAGYSKIAAEICNAETDGAAGTALTKLPYRKRPVPMYPFEEITEADISPAICYR